MKFDYRERALKKGPQREGKGNLIYNRQPQTNHSSLTRDLRMFLYPKAGFVNCKRK